MSPKPAADDSREGVVPADVARLVVAAREMLDTGIRDAHGWEQEAEELDQAVEAFSSRVAYDNEPEDGGRVASVMPDLTERRAPLISAMKANLGIGQYDCESEIVGFVDAADAILALSPSRSPVGGEA